MNLFYQTQLNILNQQDKRAFSTESDNNKWSFENFCEKKQIAEQTYVPVGHSLFVHQCVSTKIFTEPFFFAICLPRCQFTTG